MSFVVTGSALVLWASSAMTLVMAGIAGRLRLRSPGGTYFAVMMVGVVIWSVTGGMEVAVVGLWTKVLFTKLGYVGICCVFPLFVCFSFAHGRKERHLTPFLLTLLWLIPAVTIVLVATNEWHHLVWTGFTPAPGMHNVLLYEHGPWYWGWVAYSSIATLLGTTVLMLATPWSEPFYRRQAAIFLAAVVLPWGGEILYLWPGNPIRGLDFVPIGFALAGAVLLIGISRFRLLDVVPMARADLLDHVSEGMIVLDSSGRIVDLNAAARTITGIGPGSFGLSAASTLEPIHDILEVARITREEIRAPVAFPAHPARLLELTVRSLGPEPGRGGQVLILRDLPAQPVRPAGPMIPMCSSCRRVRDEGATWQSLEQYVQARWDVQFTHGLCDDCIPRVYPELLRGSGGSS